MPKLLIAQEFAFIITCSRSKITIDFLRFCKFLSQKSPYPRSQGKAARLSRGLRLLTLGIENSGRPNLVQNQPPVCWNAAVRFRSSPALRLNRLISLRLRKNPRINTVNPSSAYLRGNLPSFRADPSPTGTSSDKGIHKIKPKSNLAVLSEPVNTLRLLPPLQKTPKRLLAAATPKSMSPPAIDAPRSPSFFSLGPNRGKSLRPYQRERRCLADMLRVSIFSYTASFLLWFFYFFAPPHSFFTER